MNPALRTIAGCTVPILLVLALTGCAWPKGKDYFVTLRGDDAAGDGSSGKPWRTVQYAVDHIPYRTSTINNLHVGVGDYDGKLTIANPIAILGAGSGTTTVRNSANTDYVIEITGGLVTLRGLTVDGNKSANPGIRITNALPTLEDINVSEPGGFGIVLHNCQFFAISHCTVGTDLWLFSDIGIDVQNDMADRSTGTIENLSAGDFIDHIINISKNCDVTIRDSQLRGSPIWWADGVRIQGASTVTISNTTITRPPESETPPAGKAPHNLPYAGVEIAMPSEGGELVTIQDCNISGFDVGIGINMIGNRLLVQHSTLDRNVWAGADTIFSGTSGAPYPLVDFGGGILGSAGGNAFGEHQPFAFYHRAPYDLAAHWCIWHVPASDIPARIHDHTDDPAAGRVQY